MQFFCGGHYDFALFFVFFEGEKVSSSHKALSHKNSWMVSVARVLFPAKKRKAFTFQEEEIRRRSCKLL